MKKGTHHRKTNFSVKYLDHLGIVAGMCKYLGIARKLDELFPNQDRRCKVSIGQAVEAMIIMGLGFNRRTLYMTPDFYRDKPVELLLGEGIEPDHLNDDKLGRTLDALYERGLTDLFVRISGQTVRILGIENNIAHLDSSAFTVEGEYRQDEKTGAEQLVEPKDGGPVKIVKGYNKNGQSGKKQVVLNLICTHKSRLPLWIKAGNGNQSDKKEFVQLYKSFVKSMQEADMDVIIYMVMDSAFHCEAALREIVAVENKWITRVPHTLKKIDEAYASILPEQWVKAGDKLYTCEVEVEIFAGMKFRWVVVRDDEKEEKLRVKLEKIRKRLEHKIDTDHRKLERKKFKCMADAEAAASKLEHAASWELVTKEKYVGHGRPTSESKVIVDHYRLKINTRIDEKELVKIENRERYFTIATNQMDRDTLSAAEILKLYRSQAATIEPCFRVLKDREFMVDTFFVKSPHRIEALLFIMSLCLLVYASIEHLIRKNLLDLNEYVNNQLKKPVQNPTTRWIFQVFKGISLVYHEENLVAMTGLTDEHLKILKILGPVYEDVYG